MGAVDPKRVGVVGHSWGGFDTAFLATHTNGVFAAAVAGAPITDLVSNYGNHHWSSGIAETDHIETGQQRMEVPLYEDLPDYIANSAVFNVQNMTVPLLIEVGDADGTVFWHQGVELYNIARRAKKNVVMLVYNGEDHGLRQKKNQVDYQHRILEWFGHYLKDAIRRRLDHARRKLSGACGRSEKGRRQEVALWAMGDRSSAIASAICDLRSRSLIADRRSFRDRQRSIGHRSPIAHPSPIDDRRYDCR